jgi:hypothetical protein
MSRLGTTKTMEKLARQWRRVGGSVVVTNGNHLRWTLGELDFQTALTPKNDTADVRRVTSALAEHDHVWINSMRVLQAECRFPGCTEHSEVVPESEAKVLEEWAKEHGRTHGPDFKVQY